MGIGKMQGPSGGYADMSDEELAEHIERGESAKRELSDREYKASVAMRDAEREQRLARVADAMGTTVKELADAESRMYDRYHMLDDRPVIISYPEHGSFGVPSMRYVGEDVRPTITSMHWDRPMPICGWGPED